MTRRQDCLRTSAHRAALDPRTPCEVDQTQTPTLLRCLSGAGQVRRFPVQVSDPDFPVVDYVVSPPSSDARGNIAELSNHLTLVPSGHPRR
ncbi:MAG: hypothetical protein M0008_01740 [Actinomycetota bacterium]|nr:hypothetical protein [Actinomycetota bacterium]